LSNRSWRVAGLGPVGHLGAPAALRLTASWFGQLITVPLERGICKEHRLGKNRGPAAAELPQTRRNIREKLVYRFYCRGPKFGQPPTS
jgi:hypothetical protein